MCNTLLPSVNLYLDRIEFIIIRLAIESSPTSSIAVQFYEAAGINCIRVNRAVMKGQSRVREIGRKFFGSWSIEPAFVLFYLGYTIKTGAGIVEQLILDKVSQAYYIITQTLTSMGAQRSAPKENVL